MKRCGLLGEKLGHSYSPAIHAELADYEYRLYEVAPEKLGEFLTGGGFDGMNVTIPYKKAVIPYCAELSPIAQKLQSVNVLVRREDGTLYGDNADAYGFAGMVRASGIQIDGKKTLVLGSGGASSTVCAVLEEMGARSVTIISRKGEDNYNNLDRHADAEVIVNTTPVGMYPRAGAAPVENLASLPHPELRRVARRPVALPEARGCARYRLQPRAYSVCLAGGKARHSLYERALHARRAG